MLTPSATVVTVGEPSQTLGSARSVALTQVPPLRASRPSFEPIGILADIVSSLFKRLHRLVGHDRLNPFVLTKGILDIRSCGDSETLTVEGTVKTSETGSVRSVEGSGRTTCAPAS